MNLDNNLVVPVVDCENNSAGTVSVDSKVFGYPLRKDLIHLVLRYQAAHKRDRSGFTQKAKNRSEVAGAHRKAWGQKESGRARQGDMKAPHCYGGGVAFGINPRSYSFKLPKKVRALALASVLSHKIKNNGLCVLSEGSFEKLNFSKTKDVNRTRDIFIKTGRDKIVFIYDQIDSEQTKGCRLADFTYMLDVNALNVKSLCECFIVCKNESILYKIQDLLKIRLAGVK